jgi:hypothetical protein
MSSRWVGVFVVLCACGADAESGKRAPAAVSRESADAGSPPADAGKLGSGSAEAAFVPPDNASFETARAVDVGGATMQRVVNDQQVDYYSFEAKAGVFYELGTAQGRFSPDNVLRVFDPSRALVAENDKGSRYPNDHVDARLVIRPEHTGTYYVTVEDRVSQGVEPEGHFVPPLFYQLSVREITSDTAGYALEVDDALPATLTLQADERMQNYYVTLLGELGDGDELDTIELQGMLDRALIGTLHATGPDGDGSTAQTLSVRVVANDDGHLLATCSLQDGQLNIHPPVDDAKYRVEIRAGEHTGGNGFYALDLVLLRDNPHERTDTENNSIDGAEPVMLGGASTRRGLLLSRLPADDVDYYRFDAQAMQRVAVTCEGESGGSGIRGMKAELVAPTRQPLASAREDSPKPLLIEPVELEQSGTFYLKLSSETPAAAEGGEPWVRCAVIIEQ